MSKEHQESESSRSRPQVSERSRQLQWLNEIERQLDDTVPYYLPTLVAFARKTYVALMKAEDELDAAAIRQPSADPALPPEPRDVALEQWRNRERAAWESAVRFLREGLKRLRHAEAVGDCWHCNLKYVLARLDELAQLTAAPSALRVTKKEEEEDQGLLGTTDMGTSTGPPSTSILLDLQRHLTRQREFSLRTFGPGQRTAGVVDHIRKELREIESKPNDLSEWIDVVILAFDGAHRAGYTPAEIAAALVAKQTRNEGRKWPDWRTSAPDQAIEHVRSGEA